MLKTDLASIMSEDVVTLKENATVGQAAHILLRFRINGILIVKKDDKNKIVGIITTTDLLQLLGDALTIQGQRMSALEKIAELPVTDVASKSVLQIQKNTKIEKVTSIMSKQNKHTIPVFDGDRLIGVVGRHDILNAAVC